MAKDKRRSGEHSKKHVFSQEAIYVISGLFLFIFAIMGIINRSGIIGNLIRYALIYVIGSMYILPLVALAGFGLYLFFMRQKPKIKIGVFTAFFLLLIVFVSIYLSKDAVESKDVFDYYNSLVEDLRGNDFYIDRSQVSKLGGGLIGHVIFFAFARLLNTEGIIIVCYLVIFASLFVLLKPLLYRLVNFVRGYISKSGILEKKLKKEKSKDFDDGDDIPPEFSVDDIIINPSDGGQSFNVPFNEPNRQESVMVQPRTVSQEIAKEEDVRVTKTNEVPPQNVSRPSYQHQEVPKYEFPKHESYNEPQTRKQPKIEYTQYTHDEHAEVIQSEPSLDKEERPTDSTQGFSYKPIVSDIYLKGYSRGHIEEPSSGYQEPSIITQVNETKSVKEPSEPFMVKNTEPSSENKSKPNTISYESFVLQKEEDKKEEVKQTESYFKEYKLPPFSLLKDSNQSSLEDNHQYAEEKIELLQEKLKELNVKAEVVDYTVGPTFTRIEIRPDPGVKVAQINSIKDDLMLGMAVSKMRMESPIPGKSAIGIEIPNEKRRMVRIKDILNLQSDYLDKVMIALGMDVDGEVINANVSKMPHLLIAGGSGSGKSVCISTIITSLLLRYSPSDLRLLLVDLKQVELSNYQDLPHLICPIITQPKEAVIVLDRLVDEMEKRYDLLKKYQARDINQFNRYASLNNVDKIPYLIVIIDEFADLMVTSSKEVEFNVQRLSQLARAAGIHLIFATQRPSVDVISGVIKSNFLTRIAFRVFSAVDSKTIIERSGAEDLLGDGDMLFSNKGTITRIQGAFVDDEEIHRVTSFIKNQLPPSYYNDFINLEVRDNNLVNHMSNFADNNDDDVIYEKIKYYVMTKENGKATISELQRRFAIGFARAGRMMDRLENEGIVSKGNGANPRDVLRKLN